MTSEFFPEVLMVGEIFPIHFPVDSSISNAWGNISPLKPPGEIWGRKILSDSLINSPEPGHKFNASQINGVSLQFKRFPFLLLKTFFLLSAKGIKR
jgi:hypothetical protein